MDMVQVMGAGSKKCKQHLTQQLSEIAGREPVLEIWLQKASRRTPYWDEREVRALVRSWGFSLVQTIRSLPFEYDIVYPSSGKMRH